MQLENKNFGENMKKEAIKRVDNVLFLNFWIFEKSPWEHYISKKLFNFLNKFVYFQSCNYKIFMKFHHVSRFFLYVLNIQ
jgi:hypothetical protein